jgi:hypothetical protein
LVSVAVGAGVSVTVVALVSVVVADGDASVDDSTVALTAGSFDVVAGSTGLSRSPHATLPNTRTAIAANFFMVFDLLARQDRA